MLYLGYKTTSYSVNKNETENVTALHTELQWEKTLKLSYYATSCICEPACGTKLKSINESVMVRLALWVHHQCGRYGRPHFGLDLQQDVQQALVQCSYTFQVV